MPTSLSLQDIYKIQQQHQFQQFLEEPFNDHTAAGEYVEVQQGGIVEEEMVEGEEQQLEQRGIMHHAHLLQHDVIIEDTSGLDVESEQIVVESSMDDHHQLSKNDLQLRRRQQQQLMARQEDRRGSGEELLFETDELGNEVQTQYQYINEGVGRQKQEGKIVRNQREEAIHHNSNDFPIFKDSPMGVYEFSSKFLAISREHQLHPKVRADLLDLFQHSMPEENNCPQTVMDICKMITSRERNTTDPSLPSPTDSNKNHLLKKGNYLDPSNEPSTSKDLTASQFGGKEGDYFTEDFVDGEVYIGDEEIIVDNTVISLKGQHTDADLRRLLPKLFRTINHLSEEVTYFRSQIQSTSNANTGVGNYGTVRKMKKRISHLEGRFGLHIYDQFDQLVLLCQMSPEELGKTIEISLNDEQRLIYGGNDITEIVLEKVDLTRYIHNPSLCGRMVADVLFSPEYLADKHILGEGQFSSRTRLKTLPPEMTQLFYDTLRKLGVSRIPEDDQEHWLYLARDGVNQRARDLKANRKRKFYIDPQPMLKEDHI